MSKTYFDQVAAQWDTLQQSFFSETVREKAYAVAGLQSGLLAADIGAGSGFITEGLLQRGLRVVAVDQSPALLEEMRLKFAGITELELRQGTAEHIPIGDQAADYAFANMVLHHVEDSPAAIREMARILKTGGRLVITDLDKHAYHFLRTEHHDRWLGFKREVVKRWLQDADLKEVAIESVGQNCCASSCGSDCASVGIWVGSGVK